jgi:hypothetical protein
MNIYRNRACTGPSTILPCQQVLRPSLDEAGVVGLWLFDEGTGTNLDDKAASPHDITIEGATWTTNGPWGKALSFDGANDQGVYASQAALLHDQTNCTIEAIVRSPLSNFSGQDPIYSENYGTSGVRFRFGRANNSLMFGWLNTAANAWLDLSGSFVDWTTWNYLVGTNANLTRVIYANGLPIGNDVAATACYNDGTFGPSTTYIARYADAGYFSTIELAYLRISNVARTAGEIMMNAKLMGFA